MCFQQLRACHCGRNAAYLGFRDNVLVPEILVNLFCPECRSQVPGLAENMIEDGGWVLEYDLPGAQVFFNRRGLPNPAKADFIFDEGYLSWQGLTPGDQAFNNDLHHRLAHLAQEDLPLSPDTQGRMADPRGPTESRWLAQGPEDLN